MGRGTAPKLNRTKKLLEEALHMQSLVLRLIGLLVLCVGTATIAAQPIVVGPIGVTTGGNNSWPFNFSGGSGRYQTCYDSTEMNLASGGLILEVRVYGTTTITTYNNLRVRLGHTTLSSTGLTSTLDNNFSGSLTTCLGPANLSPPNARSVHPSNQHPERPIIARVHDHCFAPRT
jgi:hypothetical protein